MLERHASADETHLYAHTGSTIPRLQTDPDHLVNYSADVLKPVMVAIGEAQLGSLEMTPEIVKPS